MRNGDKVQTSDCFLEKFMKYKQLICFLVSIYFDSPLLTTYNKRCIRSNKYPHKP